MKISLRGTFINLISVVAGRVVLVHAVCSLQVLYGSQVKPA